jgi:hypothetical protein
MQYFSDIAELQAIASAAKVKIKKLPPAPHHDDTITEAAPPAGPCQSHVEYFKNCRAARAAGMGTASAVPEVVAAQDEPTEREKKLAASREYHKANYVPRRRRGPGKKRAKAKKS